MGEEQVVDIPISGSNGLFDKFSDDAIGDNFSRDLANVYTDKDIGIVSRKGYSKYFSTFNLGAYPVKLLYEYIQSNGARYMIAVASRTAYYITDSSSEVIKRGLNDYDYWVCTWQDKLFIGNIDATVWNWDGTTVSESTAIPKCEFAIVYGMRLWVAREIDNGSIIYWTGVNNDVVDTTDDYEFISPDDGDVITGMKVFRGNLIIWKRYSTWIITGTDPETFVVYNINKEVGCLDGRSTQEHRGVLKWLSHKGIVQFDGTGIQKISTPIDTTMDDIGQKKITKFSEYRNTTSDWTLGTFTNSTTTAGSIYTNSWFLAINQQQISTSSYFATASGNTNLFRQFFTPIMASNLTQLDMYLQRDPASGVATISVYKWDDTLLISTNVGSTNLSTSGSWYSMPLAGVYSLTAGTSYYITITTASFTAGYDVIKWYGTSSQGTDMYTRGSMQYNPGTGWTTYESGTGDGSFKAYTNYGQIKSGTWESPSKLLNVKSWGPLVSGNQKNTMYGVEYYIKTNNSSSALSTTTYQQVYNNENITANVGKYVQYLVSFTVTIPDQTNFDAVGSTVNYMYIYYGTDDIYYQPCASVVYDDRYWLSVSTTNDSSNSTILVQDQRDNWTKFAGINAYSLAVFNQKLYSGDSNNSGQVYLQDDGYNDNGNIIDSYYTTKNFSFNQPFNEKIYKTVWSAVKSSSGTLSLDYRLDCSSGIWRGLDGTTTATKLNLNGTGDNILIEKLPFAFIPDGSYNKGRYIQFRIRNNNLGEYWTIRKLQTIADILPLR